MKNSILLASSLMLLSFQLKSQCLPSTAATSLFVNNVNALIQNNADGWWNFNTPRYEVPAVSGKSPVFSRGLWIGGQDEEQNLHLAGIRYRSVGNDYWSGPIPDSANITSSWCTAWNRTWQVTPSDIATFLGGGTPTNDIFTWPAKGNPNAPSEVTSDLAPFRDMNADGMYNSDDGDYPLIKGDQFIFWVFNDIGNVHTETGGAALEFEFHGMAYAYTGAPVVNHSTFYEFIVSNKGSHAYTDLFMGEFVDIDLGNGQDDWVGVDVDRRLVYGYNGDADDEGTSGYGIDLPMIGIQMERSPKNVEMHNFTHLLNGTGQSYTDPTIAVEYYNFLSGLTGDGLPRVNGSGDTTLFRYNGVPGVSGETMCSSATPADYRTLQSYGPLTVEQNEVFGNAFSVVFVQDPSFQGAGCPDLDPFFSRTDSISNVFEQDRCSNFDLNPSTNIVDAHQEAQFGQGSIEIVSLETEGTYNYLWSNGARTRHIEDLAAGTYTVTISNHLGCSETLSFEVDLISGVEEVRVSSIYTVVPNPARSQFRLTPAPVKGTSVKLYNMQGQLVHQTTYTERVDLSSFETGTYFIQVGDAVGFQKLVVVY